MNKLSKILIIFAGVVFLGALIYAGWSYFFRGDSGPSLGQISDQTSEISGVVIKKLSNESIFDYWVNKAGEIYFVSADGAIKKIASNGAVEDLDSKANGELAKVIPSFDGAMAIFRFGNSKNATFAVYDTTTKGWFALPNGTETAAWEPISNNRIAYMTTSGNVTKLSLFDVKKKTSQELALVNLKDTELSWPNINFLHLTEKPTAEYATNEWAFNIKNKTFSVFARDKKGLATQWSRDGKIGIRISDGALSLVSETGAVLSRLSLKSIPAKCDFGDSRLYCAASIEQESLSANFADAYLKQTQRDAEDIYLISLLGLTAGNEPITFKAFDALTAGIAIGVERPEIIGSNLNFINRFDGKLYALSL